MGNGWTARTVKYVRRTPPLVCTPSHFESTRNIYIYSHTVGNVVVICWPGGSREVAEDGSPAGAGLPQARQAQPGEQPRRDASLART